MKRKTVSLSLMKDNNKYPLNEGDLSCDGTPGTVVARQRAKVMSEGGDMSTCLRVAETAPDPTKNKQTKNHPHVVFASERG